MSKILISLIAGLVSMFGWGTGDFLAGKSSNSVGNFRTFFWMQFVGLILIAILTFVIPVDFSVSPLTLGLSILSGLAFGGGYLLLYKGFDKGYEAGNISVVAVTLNLWAVFTVLAGIFIFKEAFTLLQLIAFVGIIGGITLVSINLSDFKKGRVSLLIGVKEALLASILHGAIMWPINDYILGQGIHWLFLNLIIKLTAIFGVILLALSIKQKIKLEGTEKKVIPVIVTIGIIDVLAILSFTVGVNFGQTVIVAPIASALSLITVSLAVIFLKEKLKINQIIGIATAITGIVLISI